MPTRAAGARDLPFVQGRGDRANAVCALGLDGPQHGHQTAGMLIRRRLRGGAAPVSSTGRGKAGARSLLDCQRGLGAFRDQPPLLLGQRGIQVQHKWIGIAAQLGDDERHALGHQPSYEGDIAREPADEMLERCIRIVANSTPSSNRGDEVQLQGRLTWRRCPYSHTSVNKRSAIRSF